MAKFNVICNETGKTLATGYTTEGGAKRVAKAETARHVRAGGKVFTYRVEEQNEWIADANDPTAAKADAERFNK